MSEQTRKSFDLEQAAREIGGSSVRHRIDLAEVRANLPSKHAVYWVRIAPGRSLGLRKGNAWTWYGRVTLQDRNRERKLRLAYTEDSPGGNKPLERLSFDEAVVALNEWADAQSDRQTDFAETAEYEIPEAPKSDHYTVARAAIDYLSLLKESGQPLRRALSIVKTHVLPRIGGIALSSLEARDVDSWRRNIAASPKKRRRNPEDGGLEYWRYAHTDEQMRQRRVTANVYLFLLKRVLDLAYFNGHAQSDQPWKSVRPFQHVLKKRPQLLSAENIARLLTNATPATHDLIAAALATGCRLSELMRLRVGDIARASSKIRVIGSKTWRTRQVLLADDAVAFFFGLAKDRDAEEPLLVREDGRAWTYASASARVHQLSKRLGLRPAANFICLRHTYATNAARNGMPIRVLAQQLGHQDAWVTEHYYVHYTQDQSDEEIRSLLPRMLPNIEG